MRYDTEEDCADGLGIGLFLHSIGVGKDGGCAVGNDVAHQRVRQHASQYECCVGDLVGEEKNER